MYKTNKLWRYLLSYIFLFTFISPFYFTGCSALKVKLVGDYDEIIDTSVNNLQKSTYSFISKLSSNIGTEDGSYEKNKQFYSDVKGELTAMIVRAELLEKGLKKTTLTTNLKNLQVQYDDLEQLHKSTINQVVLKSVQDAFGRSFRAIVEYIMYLKWNQEEKIR